MDFDHDNVRLVVEEDRLSSLPNELIHKILSSFDMKFVVQTCSLSSRWKLLWTTMTCLNFSSRQFHTLRKFAKFVNHVLYNRNHQIEVSSVNLDFHGASNQVFVKKIANYAFSRNVQQLTVNCWPKKHYQFPSCLFSSQSLKHLTFAGNYGSLNARLDFPALTTLYLKRITLCDEPFSKCVNLKNITLEHFSVKDVEVFDIITPLLSDLRLILGICSKAINVIAPKLENLTINNCSIRYLNAPSGLSSFCYRGCDHPPLSNYRFHSLNEVTIYLFMHWPTISDKEEDARKIINMLQKLHSARYLTLNADIIECIFSFPDLLAHHPSLFNNLISLTIDSSRRSDAYKVKMSTEVRNFLVESSPSTTLFMK